MSDLLSSPLGLSKPVMVALDVVGWACVHTATGYLVHKMPARRFSRDGWLWRQRRFERDGRFYVTRLRIRRWKHLLPEAGDLFPGGFDKGHLHGRDDGALAQFVGETRRAELGHWLAFAASPLFLIWNPPLIGAFMIVVYAPLSNGWCIAAQRYNRIRLQRVLRVRSAGRRP